MRPRRLVLLLLCPAVLAGAAAPTAVAQTTVPATTVTIPPQSTPATAPPAGTAVTPATAQPGAPATTAPAAPQPGATTTATQVSAETGGRSHDDRTAVILVAVIGALLVLVALLWALARWLVWEPAWLIRARHATAEAGWRTGNAWAEFRDWIRLGR